MTLFRPPARATRKQAVAAAQEFFDIWVSSLPGKRAWFVEEVAARTRWAPDGSIESLDGVEQFVHVRLSDEVPGVHAPSWKTHEHVQAGISDYGLALVEGLTAYMAEILLPATGTDWRLEDDPLSVEDLQPALTDASIAPPWRLAMGTAARHAMKVSGPTLRQTVEGIIELRAMQAAQEAAGLPTTEHLIVGVELYDDDDDWDGEVQIPEYAESEIGFEAYASLEDRIAAVPGVVAAMAQDREIFLVRLTSEARSNPESVRAGVQAIIDEFASTRPPRS